MTWLAEGKNPVHVKEAMGHADLATTMGYTHLAKEHLRALVEQEPRPGAVAGSRLDSQKPRTPLGRSGLWWASAAAGVRS